MGDPTADESRPVEAARRDHYVRDENEPSEAQSSRSLPPPNAAHGLRRLWQILSGLLDDVEHDDYVSNAPGSTNRRRIFPFNGNGWGR